MAKRKSTRDKQRCIKHMHKTKDRVTRTLLKTGGERRCSRRVSSSCSTIGTRRVNLVTNPVISHEWGKDRDYRLPTIVSHLNMLNYKTIKECRFSSNYQRVPILQQLSKSADSPATIKECWFSSNYQRVLILQQLSKSSDSPATINKRFLHASQKQYFK